jgi:hypothetical protein
MNKAGYPKSHRLGYIKIYSDMKFHGRVNRLCIYYDTTASRFLVVDSAETKGERQRLAAILDVVPIKNRLKIQIMRIDSQYQGYGLAPKIYKQIMKSTGKILEAGSTQSAGGRSIWYSLCKMSGVTVYAVYNNQAWLLEADEIEREPSCYECPDIYLEKYRMFACIM